MIASGGTGPARSAASAPRLPRAARREQILAAATEAFARGGFAGTGLEAIATEAGVTRVILYRHFDSKADLYRAVLARARDNLGAAVGPPGYTGQIVDALLAGAARDPAGFRLLFQHAAREPEFRAEADRHREEMYAAAHQQLAPMIPDPGWLRWAAHLTPAATITAIAAWLDAGQPEPDRAAERIRHALVGIVDAARRGPGRTG
ncbi:TetR/AcrR family transcriptional regulator [Pseudonocardia sp.]|uniref:TetR/AcrR family transcriptional regulator n=1 Tax=Pseudonocardia sp. TaxID=60912 RepID=UPI0026305771|nr:TetR/AcrR family transcriptional regulator [Pseudonocardia sp.]